MIDGKLRRILKAEINDLTNGFLSADPIAQMQYEYDVAVPQLG